MRRREGAGARGGGRPGLTGALALLAPGLLLVVAACTPGRERAAELLGPEALCTTAAESYACGRAIEDVVVERYPTLVRRDGGTLTLRVGEREGVAFEDTPSGTAPERARRYTFRGLLGGPNFYLVQVHYASGSAYALVHGTTGRTQQVPGTPVFSPDPARFAALRAATEARGGEVQVWRVRGDSVAQEWAHPGAVDAASTRGTTFGQPVWVDARTLRVVRTESDPGATRFRETTLLLRLGSSGWTAVETGGR